MPRSEYRESFTDVSGQYIGAIVEGQAVQKDFFTLEDGTDKLFRNVGKHLST